LFLRVLKPGALIVLDLERIEVLLSIGMMDLDVRKAMPAVQISLHGGPEAPAHERVDRGKTVALQY
jgi:hypothetical protein